MAGNFLLDTNIVSAALDGDPTVWAEIVRADQVAVPSIVVGELQFGALNSGQPQKNLQQIDDFLASIPVLLVDLEVARHYGRIRWQL
jgi:tRNA(fMet)-specific endonuclease VapC